MENLVKELTQGREVVEQLQIHLNNAQSSNLVVNREFLVQKIIDSYDQALSMIKHGHPGGDSPPGVVVAALESPRSLAGSEDSEQDLEGSKKRWTKKVKVWAGAGIEEPLDDGFGWRKYGQKDILGAKFPRGYYRCTHRHSQGCLATKQVQRSNDDPTMYEITYKRKHTCTAHADPINNNNMDPPTKKPDPQNENPNPLPETRLQSLPQTNLNFQTSPNEKPSFYPFNFPSSSTINPENNLIFSGVNELVGNYSPNLMTRTTFGSNYFPISPHVTNNNYDGSVSNLYTSEFEPTPDTHFPFGSSEFGSNFDFGNREYYP